MTAWIQGGPFLEVSLILKLELDRQAFVKYILSKLKSFTPAIAFAITENELNQKIAEFVVGYPDDADNPNSKIYHSTQIPIYVDAAGKRKSILSLEQISNELIVVAFWFYGSKFDEPEWNQKGISEGEVPVFKSFLHKLFDEFNFIIGTIGYEESVLNFFTIEEGWPDGRYNLDNVNKQLINVDNYLIIVIANKKYLDLNDIQGLRTAGNKQVLEEN